MQMSTRKDFSEKMNCAYCPVVRKICRRPDGKGPPACPTIQQDEILKQSNQHYHDDDGILEFARQASIQEGEAYANRKSGPYVMQPQKTRLEELIEFAGKMGYRKLGIAFCGGVTHEASILSGILETHGFDVVAVSCKVGSVQKETIGIQENQKIRIGEYEAMCNPIGQAELLNNADTDFNIMLGLCVGHDSLFLKYIKGLTTIMAVKDRVTGHNPMAALYTAHSYYQKLKKLEMGSDAEMKSRMVAGKK
jgi:uncharacterized metal-binding protein